MNKGQTITRLGETYEIKSIGEIFAKVYQLDDNGNKFKLFGKDEYLLGRITIKETKLLNL